MTTTTEQQPTSRLEIFTDLEQGTPEWLQQRCGIITASVIGQFITQGAPDALTVECPKCEAGEGAPCVSLARKIPAPIKTPHDERAAQAATLPPVFKVTSNDYSRALTMTLVSERITGYVVPTPMTRNMERGTLDEPYARDKYSEHHAPVHEVGFMVREYPWGRIGYSPDGLVGDDGLIEIKAPEPKKHLATILADRVPFEHMAQLQTGLLVSGRKWIDFNSYSGGMPLWTRRVYPDPAWQQAIIDAAMTFEDAAATAITNYRHLTQHLPTTTRIDHFAEIEF